MDLTVKNVAELKGCSERFIRKLIKESKITAVKHPGQKGYVIPVDSLDPRLQQKYYKAHGIQMRLPDPKEKKEAPPPKRFDEFSEAEREKISCWIDILQRWKEFRAKYRGKKLMADDVFVSSMREKHPDLNISLDILYRKQKALDSKNLAGLIEKRGKWNKGQTKLPKEIFDIFVYHYLDERKPAISECIEAVRSTLELTAPELLEAMPSYYTFRRELQKISKPILTLGREGEKAYKDRCAPYIVREYEHMQSNDYWIADNHTLDIFSRTKDSDNVHRLSLCCFIDARSGMPVGWNIPVIQQSLP